MGTPPTHHLQGADPVSHCLVVRGRDFCDNGSGTINDLEPEGVSLYLNHGMDLSVGADSDGALCVCVGGGGGGWEGDALRLWDIRARAVRNVLGNIYLIL